MTSTSKTLTSPQRAHFLRHGWLRIPSGVTPPNIAKYMDNHWVRLGFREDDKSTWLAKEGDGIRLGEVKLNAHRSEPLKGYVTDECWGAICDLVGGEERLSLSSCIMDDALVGSFGAPETEGTVVPPQKAKGWHIDGDSFVRFLDSPRALVAFVLMTDVEPDGGPTAVAEDSIKHIAKFLHDQPTGWTIRDVPKKGHVKDCVTQGLCKDFSYVSNESGVSFRHGTDISKFFCHREFLACFAPMQLTGKAGDVILAHALLAHCRTHNPRRIARFIRNPQILLKQPLRFDRADPRAYSLIEEKILQDLGVTSLPDWKITAERVSFDSPSGKKKEPRIKGELKRLREWRDLTGERFESVHDLEGKARNELAAE